MRDEKMIKVESMIMKARAYADYVGGEISGGLHEVNGCKVIEEAQFQAFSYMLSDVVDLLGDTIDLITDSQVTTA